MELSKMLVLGLLYAVLVQSCDLKRNQNQSLATESSCPSKVISLMFITDQSIDECRKEMSESDQSKIRIELIDALNYLTKKIIEKSGGIAEGSDQLYNSCEGASDYLDYFEDQRKNRIGDLYKKLDTKDPISSHYVSVLNRYFYADSIYFSTNYFNEVKLFQLTTDLFIMQLEMLEGI